MIALALWMLIPFCDCYDGTYSLRKEIVGNDMAVDSDNRSDPAVRYWWQEAEQYKPESHS